jgi:hypothetical protein
MAYTLLFRRSSESAEGAGRSRPANAAQHHPARCDGDSYRRTHQVNDYLRGVIEFSYPTRSWGIRRSRPIRVFDPFRMCRRRGPELRGPEKGLVMGR